MTRNRLTGILCAAGTDAGHLAGVGRRHINTDDSANAPPGTLINVFLPYHFRDTGTNPRFTEWSFSPKEHLDESDTVLAEHDKRRLFLRVKTPEQLQRPGDAAAREVRDHAYGQDDQ